VLVACFGIGKLIVGDGDLGGVAFRGKVDGDEGVGGGAVFPAPGVDELAGRVDAAVGSEDGVDVTAFVSDVDAVLVADAGVGGVVVGGGESLAELVGVGPGLEEAFDSVEGEPVGGLLHGGYGETAHADTAGFLLLDEACLLKDAEVLEDGGHGNVVRTR
jgi:hypothetical protein